MLAAPDKIAFFHTVHPLEELCQADTWSNRSPVPLESIVIIVVSSFNAHQLITLKLDYKSHQYGPHEKSA